MSDSIIIKEQTHKWWKTGTYISAIMCVILFAIYWNTANPLWGNSYRLGAFVFFALMVLGCLKLMNSSLTVILSSKKDHLITTYKKQGKSVHEEQFDVSSIKEITAVEEGKNVIDSYLQPDTRTLKVNFNDSEREVYLFKFSGRLLFFDPKSIKKVEHFLKEQNIIA